MTFPPAISAATAEQLARMQAAAQAREGLTIAAAVALDYAGATALHTADLWTPEGEYDLGEFLPHLHTRAYTAVLNAHEHHTGGVPGDLKALVVVPAWAQMARGKHAPDPLQAPDWELVYEPVVFGPRPGSVARAIALVSNGRRPSLLRADWQWSVVFPFATPTPEPEPEFDGVERACVEGPCDEGQAQA